MVAAPNVYESRQDERTTEPGQAARRYEGLHTVTATARVPVDPSEFARPNPATETPTTATPYATPSHATAVVEAPTNDTTASATLDMRFLDRQLAYIRARNAELTAQLEALKDERFALVADAAGNEVAMFILHKIIEAGRLDLATLTENLKPPYGWLAFARLWRAGLVDCLGREVLPTHAGVDVLHELMAAPREVRGDRG